MKNILVALIAACMIVSCGSEDKDSKELKAASADDKAKAAANQNTDAPVNKDITTIEWLDSTSIDLGTIKEGQVVEARFRFRNSGNKNLVIESVSASCGCTVPERPEKPIPPGGEDVIKAKFDSRGKPGEQHKSVSVQVNTAEGMQTLFFKVQVQG